MILDTSICIVNFVWQITLNVFVTDDRHGITLDYLLYTDTVSIVGKLTTISKSRSQTKKQEYPLVPIIRPKKNYGESKFLYAKTIQL